MSEIKFYNLYNTVGMMKHRFCLIFFTGFWDTRKGSQPVEVTPIEKSHRDPIFDVRFIQSKTGKKILKVNFLDKKT